MKKITLALFAILAIALSSCSRPKGVTGSLDGFWQQTDATDLVYTGTIDGQFIDHTMVPVNMPGVNQVIWAYFGDADYKTAVSANQAVAAGDTVVVKMKQHDWWWNHQFQIISVEVKKKLIPTTGPFPTVDSTAKKPPVAYRKPQGGIGNCVNGGTSFPIPQTHQVCLPVVPNCGTTITISGNSGQISINGGTNITGAPPHEVDKNNQPETQKDKTRI